MQQTRLYLETEQLDLKIIEAIYKAYTSIL